MEEKERQLHRADMAQLYVDTAERYEHSAIFMHPNPDTLEEDKYTLDKIREIARRQVLHHAPWRRHLLDSRRHAA